MKLVLLFCVRTYIKIGLFFYFKKIEVRNQAHIPKDKPILFLGNHQNALMDPLIMAVTYGRYAHFLTRAQVFNKPLVKRFLSALQLIPVYRVRDGWQTIKQNQAVFSKCITLLNNNAAVTIFPEGNHNINRTVRPLSKGFTRIVLGVLEENPLSELQLIPVGLNYKNAAACPDEVMINYGEPISASKYLLINKNKVVNCIKSDVYESLTQLTTHVKRDTYNKTLAKLESLNVNFLEPEKVNASIISNFETSVIKPKARINYLKLFFIEVLKLVCFVPFLIWKKGIQPKIKEIEFTSTFRFAIAITLVPLWLLLISFLLIIVFSGSIGLYFVISALIIALLAVKL